MKTRKMKMVVMSAVVIGIMGLSASSAWAAPSNPFVQYTDDADTVGLFHMNENTGQYVGDVGGAVQDPLYGVLGSSTMVQTYDPAWVSGKFGSALAFTKSESDRVTLPDMSSTQQGELRSFDDDGWTFEAWICPTSASLKARIISQVEVCAIRFELDGKLKGWAYASGGNNDITSNVDILSLMVNDDVDWHHVAMSYDPTDGSMKLWVDAVEIDATSNIQALGHEGGNGGVKMAFGAYDQGGAESFDGLIDEVRISNVQRTFIPEPASMLLLLSGAIALLRRK